MLKYQYTPEERTTGNFFNSDNSGNNTRRDDKFSDDTNQLDSRDGIDSGSDSGSSCDCNFLGRSLLDTNTAYDILRNSLPEVYSTKNGNNDDG